MSRSVLTLFTILLSFTILHCGDHGTTSPYEFGVFPLADSVVWKGSSVIWDTTQAKNPISMLIVATDWCGWCSKLKAETLSDRSVCGLLQSYFNSCIIDAEQDSLIAVRDTAMSCREAVRVIGGITGYPTMIFFNQSGGEIGRAPGYMEARRFADMLWKVVDISGIRR